MRVVAEFCLHYGLDTLPCAVRSIIDAVDAAWFIYSPVGSHGHRSDLVSPDHAIDLYEAARKAAGDKFHWYADTWPTEGSQRETIYRLEPSADLILRIDADEIYQPGLAEQAIAYMAAHPDVTYLRLPFIHFWRSFQRAILHDPAYPTRLIRVRGEGEKEATLDTDLRVLHLGYAQSSEIVRYKLAVHGHKNELKAGWFDGVFMDETRTTDLHPVGSDYWNTEPVDAAALFPSWMQSHKWWGKDIIP